MKSLLKFLVPVVLIIIAFIGDYDKFESTALEDHTYNLKSEVVSYNFDNSVSDSNLYLPRQTSLSNVLRVQSTAKRTNHTYKNNYEFVKTGKIVNTGIKNFIQKESLNIQYLFIKPAHRLISLGKLLI